MKPPTTHQTAPVLYHYPASPYAEKVRLLFALSQTRWSSVLVDPQPPRPVLQALVGGYRRIPVLQIGADVFCDSRICAKVIATESSSPELSEDVMSRIAADLAREAEGRVFFASVGAAKTHRALWMLFTMGGLRGIRLFLQDRQRMMRGARVDAPRGRRALEVLLDFCGRLDTCLQSRPFLAGDAPGYADACCYHPLWMWRRLGGESTLRQFSHVRRWCSALDQVARPSPEQLTADQALDRALNQAPRPLPDSGQASDLLHRKVRVSPSDYAFDATEGELVYIDDQVIIIARDTARTGIVHIHFPVAGYALVDITEDHRDE